MFTVSKDLFEDAAPGPELLLIPFQLTWGLYECLVSLRADAEVIVTPV
jgi:hypothetical protein